MTYNAPLDCCTKTDTPFSKISERTETRETGKPFIFKSVRQRNVNAFDMTTERHLFLEIPQVFEIERFRRERNAAYLFEMVTMHLKYQRTPCL